MSNEILTKHDIQRVGWRQFIGSSTFNYNTGMATGVAWQLYPALRKIYGNDDELIESLMNHFKYYNTNPLISPFILGATLGLEEQQKTKSLQAVQDMKAGLMGPLAGIGDTILWVMIPTIFGAIGGSMAKQGSSIGMWIFLAIYVAIFFARTKFVRMGYLQGVKLVTSFGKELSTFTDAISVLGLTVIGAVIPTSITFEAALKFKSGGVSMTLQHILNQLLPSLLPVALVAIMYYLMKKKHMKMTTLIIICIVIAMLGAATGVLKA